MPSAPTLLLQPVARATAKPGLSLPLRAIALSAAFTLVACGAKSRSATTTPTPPPPSATNRLTDTGPNAVVVRPEAGTRAKAGAFLVQVQWLSGPTATAFSSARLIFADANGHRVKTQDGTAVTPWMPSMGHGSSVRDQKITAEADQPGVVDVQQIDFIMGGDWQLQITATVNGVTDRADVQVKVP